MDIFTSLLDIIRRIDWAISLVAAIPLSILANLMTPAIANWMARRSKVKSQKRRKILEKELAQVEALVGNPILLTLEGQESLFFVLMWLGLGLLLNSVPIINLVTAPLAAICFLYSFLRAFKHVNLLRRCKNFPEYKADLCNQINSLIETNPH